MPQPVFPLRLVEGDGSPMPPTPSDELIANVMRAVDEMNGVCHEWAERGGLSTYGNSPKRSAVKEAVKAAMAGAVRQHNAGLSA